MHNDYAARWSKIKPNHFMDDFIRDFNLRWQENDLIETTIKKNLKKKRQDFSLSNLSYFQTVDLE